MSAELRCRIPFRASTARFDRPAASLADLLDGEGADFVHQAAWTVLDRRATPDEHALWLAMVSAAPASGKADLLTELAGQALAKGLALRPAGLGNYLLLHQRRNTAVAGPVLAALTALHLRYPRIGWPLKFIRSIPGKIRWTYRHSRKALLKVAGRLEMPTPAGVKTALGISHAPVPEGTPPLVAQYYDRLVAARLEQRRNT